jgi:cell division protein FtsN
VNGHKKEGVMNDTTEDRFGLNDPDRLPWLETADGYEYEESASPLKVLALVVGGLALLAAIVGGIYWVQRNQSGGQGNGELIAAQEGNYKVAPSAGESKGKSFEGEGDAAFAASEGKKVEVSVDPAKAKAAAAAAAAPAAPVAPSAAIPAGAAFVQLGAYSDSASAQSAWTALGKRFGAISGSNKRIAEGSAEGGRKVFRLQAVAANAAEAQQLCAKLKAAGENCMVVK